MTAPRAATVPVYLDYAATTPLDPRVGAQMAKHLLNGEEFGNPASASHRYGETAAALGEQARSRVAAAVGAQPGEVYFTSGATEANNLALFGAAHYYRDVGRHVITVRTEHKAVLDPCRELARRGWRVTVLTPQRDGRVSTEQIAQALAADTVLVSVMQVNNEIGVVQDVSAIGALCRQHPSARLHVDAAQAVGKVEVDFAATQADFMSLSAHKAYGPKGVGALLMATRSHVSPLHLGGGQERGLRAGTLPTHQLLGMGLAYELADREREAERARLTSLQDQLWRGLEALGDVYRNGAAEHGVPHLLNVSFDGVEGESLLAAVRERIAVSTGSACTSASAEPSYVLRALGRNEQLSESSLRFGMGRFTTERDIETALLVVSTAVRRLRRIAGA